MKVPLLGRLTLKDIVPLRDRERTDVPSWTHVPVTAVAELPLTAQSVP
jgi:hypothetical protein